MDAWDNIVDRTGTYWNEDDVTGTQTYDSHDRNTAWTYEASGNLVSMNEPAPNQMPFVPAQHIYDAGGHHVNVQQTTSVQSPNNPNLVLTTTTATSAIYDGSGQRVARTETRQTNANPPSVQTTYFLRSSVLGGQVISDYDAQGTRTGGYVYAGGNLLYVQRYGQNMWHFVNPATGDARDTDITGKLINDTHLDPEGVNTGASDPAGLAGGPEPAPLPFAGAYAAYLPHSLGGAGNCTVNGAQTGCAFAESLRSGGATDDCPDGDCEKPHQVTLIARNAEGRPIKGGSTTILVLPGQPGWDGSRDGTYTAVGFLTKLNGSKEFAADFLRAAGHPDKNGIFDVNEESLWQSTQTDHDPKANFDSPEAYKKEVLDTYLPRINACVPIIFGEMAKKIKTLTAENAPALDLSRTGKELAKRADTTFKSVMGLNDADKGKYGTVYIASNYFDYRPDASLRPQWRAGLLGAFFHEWGNILSAKVAGGNERKFGDPAGVGRAKDTDTGANFQRCVDASTIYY